MVLPEATSAVRSGARGEGGIGSFGEKRSDLDCSRYSYFYYWGLGVNYSIDDPSLVREGLGLFMLMAAR